MNYERIVFTAVKARIAQNSSMFWFYQKLQPGELLFIL